MRYRWFERDVPQNDLGLPMTRGEQEEADRARRERKTLKRGEMLAIVLGAIIFLYGFHTNDVPMALLSAGFLVYEVRLLAPFLPPALRRPACNMALGFSIALFIGTIVFTFL